MRRGEGRAGWECHYCPPRLILSGPANRDEWYRVAGVSQQSFQHAANILSTYCMPTTILGAEGARGECKGPCSRGMSILVGETDDE